MKTLYPPTAREGGATLVTEVDRLRADVRAAALRAARGIRKVPAGAGRRAHDQRRAHVREILGAVLRFSDALAEGRDGFAAGLETATGPGIESSLAAFLGWNDPASSEPFILQTGSGLGTHLVVHGGGQLGWTVEHAGWDALHAIRPHGAAYRPIDLRAAGSASPTAR